MHQLFHRSRNTTQNFPATDSLAGVRWHRLFAVFPWRRPRTRPTGWEWPLLTDGKHSQASAVLCHVSRRWGPGRAVSVTTGGSVVLRSLRSGMSTRAKTLTPDLVGRLRGWEEERGECMQAASPRLSRAADGWRRDRVLGSSWVTGSGPAAAAPQPLLPPVTRGSSRIRLASDFWDLASNWAGSGQAASIFTEWQDGPRPHLSAQKRGSSTPSLKAQRTLMLTSFEKYRELNKWCLDKTGRKRLLW